jgi:hypothetical protein
LLVRNCQRMRSASFLDSSAWRHRAVTPSLLKNATKGIPAGLTISWIGHSVLLAVVLCLPSRQVHPPVVIPISVVTDEEPEALGFNLALHELGRGARFSRSKNYSNSLLSQGEDDAQGVVVAKLEQASREAESIGSTTLNSPNADHQNIPRTEQVAQVEPKQSNAVVRSEQEFEGHVSNAAAAPVQVEFVEEKRDEPPGLKITRRTDWQANPVEDNMLTYAAPGSAVRLTVREASSAGFARTDFTGGFGLTNEETSGPFGLSPTAWGANATAKSQRVDWTLVNLKNFGLTTFGYQNEVGYDFRSFGRTKKEFATPGTGTMKAGGEVRLGAFSIGLAHSNITAWQESTLAFSGAGEEPVATVDEASLAINLPRLLSGRASTGVIGKLVPTVWMTASDRQAAGTKQASTASTSFGGSWNWNYGHATLGYWNYSSDGDASIDTAWSGHGFDAHLGAYYGALGVDVSASYGHSEDVAPGWQSAGALYSSTVTLSYTSNKLPGIWASASAGNYDHDGLAYGSTSSEIYGVSPNGEYLSVATGLDVTDWFWSPELSSEDRSVKLFYRYTDALTLDSTAGRTSDTDSLVGMMVQRKF